MLFYPEGMGQLIAKEDIETNTLLYKCDECGKKFMFRGIRDEHRIRAHNQTINILPPEVFENILDFLHPNDLVNVSRTCDRYKEWVTDYFERKRQCGWVVIRIENGRPKFDFDQKQKYEKYFRSKIRNVIVYKGCGQPSEQIFQFIKKNCSKNIRSFGCQDFMVSDESHMEMIWDQIKNLEILALDCADSRLNPIADGSDTGMSSQRWINKTFSRLHTLHLPARLARPHELTDFFRNNMQIETFSFADLLSSKIHLSHLVYHLKKMYEGQYIDEIEKCYDQVDIIGLDISGFEFGVDRIARMEKVKSLHSDCENDFYFPYIQQLSTDLSNDQQKFQRIVENYPNLLRLGVLGCFRYRQFNKDISTMIGRLPKLEDLYLDYLCENMHEKFYLQKWNSVRMSIKNASNLTVYVGRYEDDTAAFKPNHFIIKELDEMESGCGLYWFWGKIPSTLIYLEDFRNSYPVKHLK